MPVNMLETFGNMPRTAVGLYPERSKKRMLSAVQLRASAFHYDDGLEGGGHGAEMARKG